jgi:hypothetical protein
MNGTAPPNARRRTPSTVTIARPTRRSCRSAALARLWPAPPSAAFAEPGAPGAEAVTPVPGVGERGAPPISRTSVTRFARVVSAGGTSAEATPRVLSSATATVSKRLEMMPSAPRTTQRRATG